ncbi:MAG: hypothetical protein ABIQ04_04615 [Candidatus Saccharimonadales bacterium]
MERFLNPQILKEEVTRKQFLRYVLGFAVAIIGINNLISNLQKWKAAPGAMTQVKPTTKPHGFGSSKFGV